MSKDSDLIKKWRNDPVAFVRDNFGAQPDQWQEQALRMIRPTGVNRLCLRACVGPGKSCLLAWGAWWFLVCCKKGDDHPKGVAVAVTADNLKDNLWPELKKWQDRSPLLSRFFTWQKERIHSNEHPETWFLSARSFAKTANEDDMGKVLSGLHSKYPFVLLDETGEMSPAIGRAAEQAMSTVTDDGMGMILQAGNPMSLQGLLYDSAVTNASMWSQVRITSDPDDPARTPRVAKEWAQEQIDKYGRDNPWVMYSILGEFPPGGFNCLLTVEEVQTAMERAPTENEYSWAGLCFGVDVARGGADASVIAPRQGIYGYPMVEMRSVSGDPIVTRVLRMQEEMGADAVFVDNTGGYGGSVVDGLQRANHDPIPVEFSGKPDDQRFYNKRTEMWWRMSEWVRAGGKLPNDPDLLAELTVPTYAYKGDRMILEPKEKIKERLGRSPDKADALALTFAQPVGNKLEHMSAHFGRGAGERRRRDYAQSNPFDRLR